MGNHKCYTGDRVRLLPTQFGKGGSLGTVLDVEVGLVRVAWDDGKDSGTLQRASDLVRASLPDNDFDDEDFR